MGFLRRHRFLITLLLLGGLGWSVVRGATSAPSVDLAVEELTRRLHDRLGLTLVVGHVGVEPGSARIEAGPVLINDADGVALFAAKRIAVEVAPLEMFSRRVSVDALEIDEPVLNLRVVDGRIAGIKLPEGSKDDSSSPLFRVDVEDFRVVDGKVSIAIDDKVTSTFSGIKTRLRSSGPDGHRLKFSVKSASIERPADRIDIDDFGGRLVVFGEGLLAPERISVSDLTLNAKEGSVNVAGSILLGPLNTIPAFDIDVHGSTRLPVLLSHVDLPVSIDGDVALGAHVSTGFGGTDLQVVGQADVNELFVKGIRIGTIRGQFAGDSEQVIIPQASWDTGGTTLAGSATVALDDNFSFTFDGDVKDFSIHSLLADLKVKGSWADVLIDGKIQGSGEVRPEFELSGTGTGTFHDLGVANRDIRTASADDYILVGPNPIAGDVSFHSDIHRLRIDGVLDDGITRAEGNVVLHYKPDKGFEVFAEANRAGFATIDNRVGKLGLEGNGAFQVQIAGPYRDPLIVAQAQLNDFVVGDFPIADAGQGHIRYRKGKLGFHGIKAKKGTSDFVGDVILNWFEPSLRYSLVDDEGRKRTKATVEEGDRGLQIAVDIDVTDGQVEDLRSIIPERFDSGVLGFFRTLEADGPVVGNVDVSGYIGDGSVQHLMGTTTFEIGAGAHLLGQTLGGGSGVAEFLPDRIQVAPLKMRFAEGDLTSQLSLHRHDGDMKGFVSLNNGLIGELDVLKGGDREFTGAFDVDIALTGLASNPAFTGSGRLHEATWGDIPIGDADLRLVHQDRMLALTGPALSGRAKSVLSVGTVAPYVYTASLKLSDGPARDFLPKDLLPDDARMIVAGAAESAGTLKAIKESRGTLSLRRTDVVFRGLKLAANGDVLAHFKGSALTLDQLELSSPRGDRISARGSVAPENVDLQLSGRGDLWVVGALLDSIDTGAGRFAFDLALTGDTEGTYLNGNAFVSDARFDVRNFDPTVDDLDARLVFRGRSVLVENARGTLGGAPFSGEGSATLDGLSPTSYDLAATYRDLQLDIPEWLHTRSSGNITLTGDASFPTLAGEVTLHQASYTEDINWERFLPEFRRQVRAPLVFDKEEEDFRFDLHLVSEGGIVVQNNVADIEAKGDLFLVGTEERPGLRGNISLLHGQANFRGNRYRLNRGTVEFTETYRVAPILDFEAETRVKDYDITAHVTGPLKSMRIDLKSQPDLAEIDILALLTLGFTQFELQDANTASTTTTAYATGLEMVSAYTGLDEEVKRILPEAVRESGVLVVDELRLTSQYSTRQQGTVPAVSVGFEMNPGFWAIDGSRLRLQSTLVDNEGSGTEQRIELEKRFDNDVRMRMVWNSQDRGACPQCNNQWGDLGLDLWYRWEF